MLDYPDRDYAAEYAAAVIQDALRGMIGKYSVRINTTHFGEIAADEYRCYGVDVYCSGNHACLKHIASMGFEVEYVDRSYDWSATKEKLNG